MVDLEYCPRLFLATRVAVALATRLPSRRVSLRFLLLCVLTEQEIQPIKDSAALLQQLAIVPQRCAQTVNDCIEARGLQTVKLVIFKIHVVNYLGYLTQTFAIPQAESFQHRLESAILAMMRELGAIHVERNRAIYCLAFSNKIEPGPLIDKLRNEPGRGQAVDVQIATRHPPPILIIGDGQRPRFRSCLRRFLHRRLRETNRLLTAFVCIERVCTSFRFEEIVRGYSFQFGV